MAVIEDANLRPWAAITGPRRAILHPGLERRDDEDPDKRWVLVKSVHTLHVWIAGLPLDQDPDARYADADAEAYARRALMPAGPFRTGAQLPDGQLAARFRVPVEKIAERRAELLADREGSRPGRLCAELEPPGPARHVAGGPAPHRRRRRRRVLRR